MTRGAERPLAEVMSTDLATVDAELPAQDALALARSRAVRHLLVMDGGCLLGLVCLCDLVEARPDEPVGEHMTAPVACVPRGATVAEVARLVRGLHVGCLPVVDDEGRPVGIVTRSDLLAAGVPARTLGGRSCRLCDERLPEPQGRGALRARAPKVRTGEVP